MSLTDGSCAVRRRLWHTCMKLVRCSILLFIGGSYPSSRGARLQMRWPHSQNISYYDQILPIPGILRSTSILSSIMSKQAEFAGVFTIVSCLGIRPVFSFLASGVSTCAMFSMRCFHSVFVLALNTSGALVPVFTPRGPPNPLKQKLGNFSIHRLCFFFELMKRTCFVFFFSGVHEKNLFSP